MSSKNDSLVEYYKGHSFNPVLIRVENPDVWSSHFAKRRNLYDRHLGIPLGLMRGARILEFGPNSGENALLPALFGARLTLVEPNPQVLPRLRSLFEKFGLSDRLEAVECAGIGDYTPPNSDGFDVVMAEGFLYTLSNRVEMLRKIAQHVASGRFGVISYNDRIGGLLELLRRAYLHRACRLHGIDDVNGEESLALARVLFAEDFARLNSSRTLEAWWRDNLVNPFYAPEYLWSLPEVLDIVESEGCEFHGCSPVWTTIEHFNWYKNVQSTANRREQLLSEWRSRLGYFLTGLPPEQVALDAKPAAVEAAADLAAALCECTRAGSTQAWPVYPAELSGYLAASSDSRLRQFDDELSDLVAGLRSERLDLLTAAYHRATLTRTLWGTAYHYISFQRIPEAGLGLAAAA